MKKQRNILRIIFIAVLGVLMVDATINIRHVYAVNSPADNNSGAQQCKRRRCVVAQSELRDIGVQQLQDFIRQGRPVVVKFYAPEVASSVKMQSVDSEMKKELAAKDVTFVQIDITTYRAVAKKYGVIGTPTYVLFYAGHVKRFVSGVGSKSSFVERYNEEFANIKKALRAKQRLWP